jgi:hypothetical protein
VNGCTCKSTTILYHSGTILLSCANCCRPAFSMCSTDFSFFFSFYSFPLQSLSGFILFLLDQKGRRVFINFFFLSLPPFLPNPFIHVVDMDFFSVLMEHGFSIGFWAFPRTRAGRLIWREWRLEKLCDCFWSYVIGFVFFHVFSDFVG